MTHLKNIKIAILFVGLLIAFSACKNNNQPENRDIQLLSDSSAYNNNTFSDTSRMTQSNSIPAKTNAPHNHVNSSGTRNSGSSGTSVSNSGTANSSSGTTRKKGWSKAAQGAVIGGVGGAIGGAIISKKKGTGAAIGGAIGAAGGYIIGRSKDKKDGRVK